MTADWVAIEERVPDPAGAVRLAPAPSGDRPLRRSRFLEAIVAACDAGRRPSTLVGPSRRVGRQWLDTIARTGTPVFNVSVTTPRALCYDLVAGDLARRGLAAAAPRARLVLVEKVLAAAHAAGRLRYFDAPRSLRRLAERMLSSLTALRMAGLDAAAIRGRTPFGTGSKAHDLALLLDAYARELAAERLVDAADIAHMAHAAVRAGGATGEPGRILVPEDLALQRRERDVFDALGARVVRLPVDPVPEAFDDPETAPRLSFSRAIGEVNEIRATLRRCLAAGIRLDEVEILHTDAAVYPPLVQEVVAVVQAGLGDPTADLPLTFADGLPIRESRPARALAAWLTWRAAGHPQWQLVRMLRDGLLDCRPDPAAADDAAVPVHRLVRELRRLSIGLHLDRTQATIRDALATARRTAPPARGGDALDLEDDVDPEALERSRAERAAALGELGMLVDRLAACEPAADARAVDVVAGARRFLETVAAARSQFDNNARNRLLAEVSEMERWIVAHPGARPAEMAEWLAGLADTLVVMGSGPRPGCLHVAGLDSGGHSGRPVTFIVGLDEGRFPGAGAADPVLTDPDRAAVSADLEQTADVAARARHDFWKLLGRLRGEVHLSFSCRDLAEQAELFPSPVVLEVFRRHSGDATATLETFFDHVSAATDSFVPADPALALDAAEWWLAALGPDPRPADVTRAIRHHGGALARGLEAEEARRSPHFTPWDGRVPDAGPALDPAHPGGRVASARSLESLGACPRRFFFTYGLDVLPLDTLEPDEDRWLDPLEHGSVLHEVLERFMREFLHAGPGRPADAPHPTLARDLPGLCAVLDRVLAARRAEKPTADETAFAARRRELLFALQTFLAGEEEYCRTTGARPVALEAAIGCAPRGRPTAFDQAEAAVVPLPGGRSLRLRGYVDRIDVDGRAAEPPAYTIIDYKSGGSTRYKKSGRDPLATFDGGRRLQHGLYVMMVRHVVRGHAAAGDVTRFTYVFPGLQGRGERVEWSAADLARVDALVDDLCGIVAAGAFLPTTNPNDCRFCDFRDACGDPATTTDQAGRKLAGDEGRYGPAGESLADLFAGVREARPRSAPGAPAPAPPRPLEPVGDPPPAEPGDAAARAAIRTDLATSMMVEASAGTGKTTCMVDRMIALVRSGAATVGQIAAITFTKKAAAELARRFRERVERDVAGAAAGPERERLVTALSEIDSAVIGTVHAFCGRLLRERPIEAGLDPAFETLDVAAEEALRGRAWREFRDLVVSDPALAAHRADLEAAGLEVRDLRGAFDTVVAHGDVRSWPCDPVDPPDVAELAARLCADIARELDGRLVPWSERRSDKLMTTLEEILRTYRTRPDDAPAALMRVVEEFTGACPALVQEVWLPEGSREARRDHKARLVEWWDAAVAACAEPLRRWHAHRYACAMPLVTAARDHYERLRLAEGVLSFHDLLVYAAALLRRRPDARGAFAGRYRFLLVDEFQDTDPLQAELLLLLAAAEPDATDWRTTTIRPGSLFVVGDPKQSIYRFRRADIGTFEFVKERIVASGGRVLELTTNFRTTRDLVHWVNEGFAARFAAHRAEAAGQYGPAFTPSAPGRDAAVAGVLAGLRQLRVHGGDVEAEAAAVAGFIRRAIDAGLTVPRTGAETRRGVPAACRPEDFMIVTWDTGRLSTYAAALNAAGLPCDVTGRKGADSAGDLAPLRLCLRVVADPDDTVAALAVLRGPVFGFSDADLHAFHAAGGRIDGRLRVPDGLAAGDLRERCTAAAAALVRWRRLAGSLPVAAAVERIAADAGLGLVAAAAAGRAGRRGRAAAGAMATLVERIRAERALVTSVQDVVDRIDDLLADTYPKRDFDTVSIDADVGGAVRVMNIHKVKGLEAPVVFLCDKDGPKRDRGPDWHVSRRGDAPAGALLVSARSSFGGAATPLAAPLDWPEHEATERRYLEAEYLRLHYVAGTRPGTCLVASVFTNAKGEVNGGWHELAPGLVGVDFLPDVAPAAGAAAAAASRLPPDDADVSAALAATRARAEALWRPTYGTVTPRDFLTEPAERIRHTGRGLGEDWGTAIHALIELALAAADRGDPGFDLGLAAASVLVESDLADSGFDRSMLVGRAVALVEDVMASPVWTRIGAGAERFVEVPFMLAVQADEIPPGVGIDRGPGGATTAVPTPVLVRGQIDLVFRDPSAPPPPGMTDWLVVDWKTTSALASERVRLAEHYRPQLSLYARCWAVAGGGDPAAGSRARHYKEARAAGPQSAGRPGDRP